MSLDSATALELTARLAAVAVVVASAELLWSRDRLAPGGVLAWLPVSTGARWLVAGTTGRVLALVFAPRRFAWLLVARGAAAAAIVVAAGGAWVQAVCIPAVFAALLLAALRNPYGTDGADQMLLVVFGALTLWVIGGGGGVVTAAALWFIALQICLAYLTAGVAKLISPVWRSGAALVGIFATTTYGGPRLGAWLARHGAVARALAIGLIGFECLFVAAVLLGGVPLAAALAAGALFHVFSAVVMGLNGFLWAFVATYPAVLSTLGGAL